ncbi:glutamine amidotransferase-related protein [Legionella hackeliae]|uniref:Putative glutamine amidotransferase, class I n=1 Tax=Legionella hackeliae TaxID=449 RepID=A0A0A8UMS6_LEGHA|nr:glutamine amidotransferase [Legionella hackeliae]KTD10540.1 glutamine amidotransferase, class I [Legionella hackeliae]CEK10043.1 putative glutamine amidotransferase, class I [Legionella hackeliae]STX46769.1 glutamine amidotransferase, class I [Legionella hackeliae]
MNIGILLCDLVKEQFQEHGQYPEMFAKLLHQVDSTLKFSVYDVRQEQFPDQIDAADAYLISGSRHCVNDDFPWLRKLEEFILHVHKAQKKIIGICFGHQLIAKVLGGKVAVATNGWGVGISTNKIIQHKSWMTPAQDNLNLIVSHRDQVVELPKDAEILAASDFCPVYMMQINNHLLTVQGHPEFSKSYSQALIEDRKTLLGEELANQGLTSLHLHVDDHLFAHWIINFLRS